MDRHELIVAKVVEIVLKICEEHSHVDATKLPEFCRFFDQTKVSGPKADLSR
jgi:hypothetical protein